MNTSVARKRANGAGKPRPRLLLRAAEKSGRGIGRIRLRRVKDVFANSLLPFVQGAVVPGLVVHTDRWSGYCGLAAARYQHRVTVISDGRDPAHEVMPRVHNVASLLKRWLIGTHQGGIQHQQLDTTSTNSLSDSTAAAHKPAACFPQARPTAVAVGPAG